jgi:rhodanese-related sulfurtransferase/transcriptional regulator with XRE-family HTH domain
MIQTLGPRDAEALIAAGGIDVVDVRDPRDWASGHVPGARSVPLEALRADPRGALPRDKVLFVCARGVRSLSAAKVAEELGLIEIYSLDGGTHGWESAGLSLESPAPSATSTPLSPAALDEIVGANLRSLRTLRALSLDAVARITGLSRSLLGQIELGKASPSVSAVWKIAHAFNVQFSALLATPDPPPRTKVLRAKSAKRLVSPDGRFSSRALFPLAEKPGVEFYELHLAAHSREDAQPHQPGTRENLIVTSGALELHVGGERFDLGRGDAIAFTADVPHSYVNPSGEDCWMYLVMTYTAPAG